MVLITLEMLVLPSLSGHVGCHVLKFPPPSPSPPPPPGGPQSSHHTGSARGQSTLSCTQAHRHPRHCCPAYHWAQCSTAAARSALPAPSAARSRCLSHQRCQHLNPLHLGSMGVCAWKGRSCNDRSTRVYSQGKRGGRAWEIGGSIVYRGKMRPVRHKHTSNCI